MTLSVTDPQAFSQWVDEEIDRTTGEQHGKLRRAAAPCKHGDPSWKAGAFFDERRMDNHSEGSVSPPPPYTSEER